MCQALPWQTKIKSLAYDIMNWSHPWVLCKPGSSHHLHAFERISLPRTGISEDVPATPIDAICESAVAAVVVASVQVGCQTGVEPPAGAVVTGTASRSVAVMVAVVGAEGSAVVVVAFVVAQGVAGIPAIAFCCQAEPGDRTGWLKGPLFGRRNKC